MTLYRFVGKDELTALLNGETLINTTDYSEMNDTNSIGFCFFADNRKNATINSIAARAEDYLGGIVNTYAIVKIEVETARRAYGWYAVGKKIEYNLTEYSVKNVVGAWLCKMKKINYFGRDAYLYRGIGEKVF